MNTPTQAEWRRLKQHGVRERIDTPEKYWRFLITGLKAGNAVSEGFTSGPWLDTGQITALHWASYHQIFTRSGEFRTTEVEHPAEKFSLPSLIRSDLRTLNEQSRNWFRSDDPNVLAKEMAAYNAAFYKIRPFEFGSDEVGRLILSYQAQQNFGARLDLESDLKVYYASLAQAVKGNFSPLAAQIIEHSPVRHQAEILRIENTMDSAQRELRARENDFSHSY